MDVNNLARVFGPTLVGHAVADPDPMTILHDTNRQPRVGMQDLLDLSNVKFIWPCDMTLNSDSAFLI